MRIRFPLLASALLLAASCGAPGPAPAPPGPDGGGPAPAPGAAAPAAEREAGDESVLPPSDPQAHRVGRVILDCDNHLRSWTDLMAQPRTEDNQQKIATLSLAFGSVVAKNREILENEAVSGAARNRGIASAALGFCGDPAVATLIASNVAAEDTGVAAKALLGLGILCAEDTPLSPVLTAVTRADATPAMASNAAFCLYQLAIKFKRDPDGSMTAAFLELLRDPEPSIRAQAVIGLGLVQAREALPQITDILAADPIPAMRTTAAYALGQIGARVSVEPLIAALDDDDEITAGTARASLARIFGRDYGPRPSAWRSAQPQ